MTQVTIDYDEVNEELVIEIDGKEVFREDHDSAGNRGLALVEQVIRKIAKYHGWKIESE